MAASFGFPKLVGREIPVKVEVLGVEVSNGALLGLITKVGDILPAPSSSSGLVSGERVIVIVVVVRDIVYFASNVLQRVSRVAGLYMKEIACCLHLPASSDWNFDWKSLKASKVSAIMTFYRFYNLFSPELFHICMLLWRA